MATALTLTQTETAHTAALSPLHTPHHAMSLSPKKLRAIPHAEDQQSSDDALHSQKAAHSSALDVSLPNVHSHNSGDETINGAGENVNDVIVNDTAADEITSALIRARPAIPHNTHKVLVLSALLFVDILFSTFATPFLPESLHEQGYSVVEISQLMSAYQVAGLAGYAFVIVALNLPQRQQQTSTTYSLAYKQWRFIVICSWIVCVAGMLPLIKPSYALILMSRIIQGTISAVFWSINLALAAHLNPMLGIEANAIALCGSSLGELSGPLVGTALYAIRPSTPFAYGLTSLMAAAVAIYSTLVFGWLTAEERAQQYKLQTQERSSVARDSNDEIELSRIDVLAVHQVDAKAHLPSRSQPATARASASSKRNQLLHDLQVAVKTIIQLLTRPFMLRFAGVLLLNGIVRTALDTVLPLYVEAQWFDHGSASNTIGALFGIGAACYVIATSLMGRLITRLRHPVNFSLVVQVVLSAVAAVTFYMPSIYTIGLMLAALCSTFAIQSVINCTLLEIESESLDVNTLNLFKGKRAAPELPSAPHHVSATDEANAAQDRSGKVMSVAMLLWSVGYAIGGQVAGFGATQASQRMLFVVLGLLNVSYTLVHVIGWLAGKLSRSVK